MWRKLGLLPVAAILAVLSLAGPANAKHNAIQIAQLLNTKECPGCDLRHANLGMSNLPGYGCEAPIWPPIPNSESALSA